MTGTPFIVFAPDIPEEEGHYPPPFDTERVGLSRNLGKAAGSVKLGFCIDRLPPGERSSFTHAHELFARERPQNHWADGRTVPST